MSKFSFKARLKSFSFAFQGIATLFKNEHNAWIHFVLTLIAIALGLYFEITSMEWIAVVICIGSVFAAELFNTSIEYVANYIQPKKDDQIKRIKDLAAAAVFIVALSSLIVGMIIFIPRLLDLL